MARFTGGGSGSGSGAPGPRGPQGPAGADGANGLSAYEIAVENGFEGTEQEWLASLSSQTLPEPLFIVVNVDGTTAWSSDAVTWIDGNQITFNGETFFGEGPGVGHVSIADNYVIYIADDVPGDHEGQIWYAETYNTNPNLVELPTSGNSYYRWSDVKFANGYTVVVGGYIHDNGAELQPIVPAYAYTTNGLSWTLGVVDPAYQSFLVGGYFSSVTYGANGWFITGNDESEASASAFFLTNLSDGIGESNYVLLPSDFDDVVWTGDMWWVKVSGSNAYFVTNEAPIGATWSQIDLSEFTTEAFGNVNGFYSSAGGQIGNDYWFMVASSNGQVVASKDGGVTFVGSVPLPYTTTVNAVEQDNQLVISLNSGVQHDVEKITLTNSNPEQYDGVFYAQVTGGNPTLVTLYEDAALTIPVDASGWGTFVSADVTFSHGTYIDGAGFGLEKFLVANDDEQILTSTDLETWTLRSDLNNAFTFWNDIDFNPSFTASATYVPTVDIADFVFTEGTNGDASSMTVSDKPMLISTVVTDPNLEPNVAINVESQDNVRILAGMNSSISADNNVSFSAGSGISMNSYGSNIEMSSAQDVRIITNAASGQGTGTFQFSAENLIVPGSINANSANVDSVSSTGTLGINSGVPGFSTNISLSPASMEISPNNALVINASNGGWSFLDSGILGFPDDTVQTTAYPGPSALGDALVGVDTAYPVIGGTDGNQPTFDGDPLFTASYIKMSNDLVHFNIQVDMDNITDFGSGTYYMTLPFDAKYPYIFRDGCVHDTSNGQQFHISGHVAAGSNVMVLYSSAKDGNNVEDAAFSPDAPVLLATDDNFHIAGTYIAQ